jgi:hypothetical protein
MASRATTFDNFDDLFGRIFVAFKIRNESPTRPRTTKNRA